MKKKKKQKRKRKCEQNETGKKRVKMREKNTTNHLKRALQKHYKNNNGGSQLSLIYLCITYYVRTGHILPHGILHLASLTLSILNKYSIFHVETGKWDKSREMMFFILIYSVLLQSAIFPLFIISSIAFIINFSFFSVFLFFFSFFSSFTFSASFCSFVCVSLFCILNGIYQNTKHNRINIMRLSQWWLYIFAFSSLVLRPSEFLPNFQLEISHFGIESRKIFKFVSYLLRIKITFDFYYASSPISRKMFKFCTLCRLK